ncbi:hypothetical protein ACH4NV_34195, partial [Streptomyces althioticus]|uniref:hypothetical protein n=1 Tax=Streptomyces althioticus TaxID=83380 RepID=UPI0037AB1FD5
QSDRLREHHPNDINYAGASRITRVQEPGSRPGRTWRSWHHHVTLVTAAQAFLTIRQLNPKVRTPA